ncbi:hypothetical protein [Janthinobacterium sp. FW305-128]|uniref:hypothetical protein n=1 Tax=Janthinobacterium sp. FW305-128 TaxID=2775055 RepID=UPI001E325D1E|nr:hypothetical protein [Janthinobacterium sp. FW305-128]MCC7684799.1 hypothetical protein [Janthinobacterium sp. FW305-128]
MHHKPVKTRLQNHYRAFTEQKHIPCEAKRLDGACAPIDNALAAATKGRPMEKATLKQEILALIEDHASRSKIARLRDVFDEIETAMAAGVKRSEILKALEKQGIVMTLATFENSLQRIRKKRKNQPAEKNIMAPVNSSNEKKEQTTPVRITQEKTSDPKTVDTILSSQPDLLALSKHAPNQGNK